MLRISFDIPDAHGPAFRSAVDDLSAIVAKWAEGQYSYPVEDAIEGALNAVGALRAAVYAKVRAPDPYYPERHHP